MKRYDENSFTEYICQEFQKSNKEKEVKCAKRDYCLISHIRFNFSDKIIN